MRSRILLSRTGIVLALGTAAALAACSADAPTRVIEPQLKPSRSASPATDKVAICHFTGTGAEILEVALPALEGHFGHGDYVTTLLVSHDFDDASDGIHFARIGDALGAARAGRLARGELTEAACRITIVVSSDVYMGTVLGSPTASVEHFPMIVDVPNITLHGALVMGVNEFGRATGTGATGDATTLSSIERLPTLNGAPTPIIVANGHPGGSAGNGLTIEGFVFQSGPAPMAPAAGQGVLSLRVTGLSIHGNRFEGFGNPMDLRASNADVFQNQTQGTGACDVCPAGPGTYRVTGNLILAGGIEGISAVPAINLALPSGVEPYAAPATAESWFEIRNNEVHDHLRLPVGSAIRIVAKGPGAASVQGTTHGVIRDNLIVNNRFGIIVDAGFPAVGADLTSDVDVALGGNQIEQSCQAKLLVSFARHSTGVGLANGPYLLNSNFVLSLGGDVSWSDVWYAHPAGFGNTLVVDGQTIANAVNQFYSAAGCPGL